MIESQWTNEFSSAITVCDTEGIILFMNEKSKKTFEKYGGGALIWKNVLDYHPEPARTKLMNMLKKGLANTYTIEKNSAKKLIHQAPWYHKGEYSGFIEISIELPNEMPHFVRS